MTLEDAILSNGSWLFSVSLVSLVSWQNMIFATDSFENIQTFLNSLHPFSTPWKHQKTLRFSDVFTG